MYNSWIFLDNDKTNIKIEDLILQLKSSEIDIRQQAAWDLYKLSEKGKIKEPKKIIQSLIEACKDNDWPIRKMAVMTLGKLNVESELPMIIDILTNDIAPEVRVGAAEALGDMKAVQAVNDLIKALDDSYNMVKQVAIMSLGKIGNKAKVAVPKILDFLLKPQDEGIIQISDLAA